MFLQKFEQLITVYEPMVELVDCPWRSAWHRVHRLQQHQMVVKPQHRSRSRRRRRNNWKFAPTINAILKSWKLPRRANLVGEHLRSSASRRQSQHLTSCRRAESGARHTFLCKNVSILVPISSDPQRRSNSDNPNDLIHTVEFILLACNQHTYTRDVLTSSAPG